MLLIAYLTKSLADVTVNTQCIIKNVCTIQCMSTNNYFLPFVVVIIQTIAEAYEDHVLLMDSPDLTYIAFDFHQH